MIEELRRRANTYLRMFRWTRLEAYALLDEIDALKAENERLTEYVFALEEDLDRCDGIG